MMINIEDYKDMTAEEMAAAIMTVHAGNCCQAVTAALTKDEQLIKAGAGFGSGIGNMNCVCGALVGAIIAAGIKTDGLRGSSVYRQINERFRECCGSIICRELKGIDTGKVLCPCVDCVRNAVKVYQEVMGE